MGDQNFQGRTNFTRKYGPGDHFFQQKFWSPDQFFQDQNSSDRSGSQDTWIGNVESTLGKYDGKRGRSRSEVICTMCIPSMMNIHVLGFTA